MRNQKKSSSRQQKSIQQSRGKNLRAKIIESEEYGEEYRAAHQGRDARTEK